MSAESPAVQPPLQREERFQSIIRELDTFRVGTLILDEDRSVVWANQDVADFFGISPGELVGRKQPSLIDSTLTPLLEDPESFTKTVRASYRDDTYVESLECHVLPGDNREERRLLYRSDPLRDGPFPGGRIEHFTDVTAYRNYERKLNQLNELHQAVLSSIRDTVVVTDEEDRFTYICPNVSFIFGCDRETVAELGTSEALFGQRLFDPADLEPKGELKNIEATVTDREGEKHVVLVTAARGHFHDGTILYSVRDITERKEREQELGKIRSKLEEANEKLRRQSREDELSGLANKRCFNEVLNREWPRHRRGETELSLIMSDIDDFKAYNDTHGHEAGDRVLRSVGKTFEAQLNRPGDLPARWGGEEFAVILPETDETGAATVADDIRRAVQALEVPHPDNPAADVVTMSFGTATLRPGDEHEPAELVRRADAALYRSKAMRKNRVTTHESMNGRETPTS